MKKNNVILLGICVIGTLYHASFLHLNEILKVADSFAYLQMSYFLSHLSSAGLGNGWFGFVYSVPIALLQALGTPDFLAGKIINLITLNISALLVYVLARKILPLGWSYIAMILFFLSPVYLHFSIHILSENLYIPLFLGLFFAVWKFLEYIQEQENFSKIVSQTCLIAILLALMYLTRAEAFIYFGSIGLIAAWLLTQRYLSGKEFVTLGSLFFLVFFLSISPYLLHLHNLTGEWGLTNKGASNLRQAELRGVEKMDDAGFEQAVAELTPDKHHLIAGFAGGMPYDRPQIEGSLGSFIKKDPVGFMRRVLENQKKLFTRNFPEIFLGQAPSLYWSDDPRFSKNILFLLWCLVPLGVLLSGIIISYKKYSSFFGISLAFFLPAFFFFTLFFTLNRYFLIFLPLMILGFCIGLREIWGKQKYIGMLLLGNYLSILLLSTYMYYQSEYPKDAYYALKKEAGEWLQTYTPDSETLALMERFPIVTYYAGSKTRYITPYTNEIQDMYEYGNYHDIDILVVDTMDFSTYRPTLTRYLSEVPEHFSLLHTFSNPEGQKVILYLLEK